MESRGRVSILLFSLTHPVSLLAARRMCAQGMLKLVNPPTTLDRLRGSQASRTQIGGRSAAVPLSNFLAPNNVADSHTPRGGERVYGVGTECTVAVVGFQQ